MRGRSKPVPFISNQGGDRFERNDCTVRAIQNVLGIPYDDARLILKNAGRKRYHGFKIRILLDKPDRFPGYRIKFTDAYQVKQVPVEVDGECYSRFAPMPIPTLGRFIHDHPTGRYVVRIKAHCVAVVDGVMHDYLPTRLKSHITGFWELTKI
jgi:hypothetical protein